MSGQPQLRSQWPRLLQQVYVKLLNVQHVLILLVVLQRPRRVEIRESYPEVIRNRQVCKDLYGDLQLYRKSSRW